MWDYDMTPAALRTWIKSRRLSHQEAADLLALSVPGLRKNLYGVNPINPQTERIIKLLDRDKTPDGRDFSL